MSLLAETQLQQHMELARQKRLKCQDNLDKATHLINLVSRRQISPTWSNNQLISWLHAMVAKHHAVPWRNATSRAQKTGKSTAAPKLCGLLPTAEAFDQNVYRAHLQVAQWYSALSRDPAPLNAVDYGWEADEANKCLIPSRNMAEWAPEQILKLVKCGCISERPCKGANCCCMGHQLPCTMFCACGGGRACLNAFNIQDTDEAVNQDVDTGDYDEDVEGDSNEEEDNL